MPVIRVALLDAPKYHSQIALTGPADPGAMTCS